ncbi:unnamed protein product, partial [Rotaria sp. Silwood2]
LSNSNSTTIWIVTSTSSSNRSITPQQ